MADVKIRIEKSDKTSEAFEQASELTKEQQEKIAVVSFWAHEAMGQAKTIMNYSISNIGNFTGNYTKTPLIEQTVGVVEDITGLALGAVAGTAALTAMAIGMAVSKGLEITSYIQDQHKQRLESEYLKARSGNSLINGSRGTEN